MARVTFLVDGFNLYHSLEEASLAMGGVGTKWLDLNALCETFSPLDRRRRQIGGSVLLLGAREPR